MAKRILSWREEKGILEVGEWVKEDAEKGVFIEYTEEFDLNELFEIDLGDELSHPFNKLNDVQKHIVVYGTKQLLADAGSQEKDFAGKIAAAKDKWELFLSGQITAPRANATGAAKAKGVMAKAAKASEVVSLEGLVVKKTCFPEKFTEEDQAKLDELMQAAAELTAQQNKVNKSKES